MPLGEAPQAAAPSHTSGTAADLAGVGFTRGEAPARPCQFIGHLFHADLRYDDGVVVGQCAVCGERAHIDHIPGGQLALRAAWLIERLLDDDAEVEDVASLLPDMSAQIDAELASLREAAALMVTAKAALTARMTRPAR